MERKYKISKQLDAYIETYVKNSEYNAYSEEDLEGLIVLKGVIYSGSVVLDEDDIFLEVLASMQEEQPCINANGNATLAEYIRLNNFVAPLNRDNLIAGILNAEKISELDSKYSNLLNLKKRIENEFSVLNAYDIYNFTEEYKYIVVHPSTLEIQFVKDTKSIPDGYSSYQTELFISRGYDYNDYDQKIYYGFQFFEIPIQKFTESDFMMHLNGYPDKYYPNIRGLDYYNENYYHMQDFIHLNVHSHYSILKSTITIPAAVDKAIADGQRGLVLTDLGVMYGIKEFVDYCTKVNKKRSEEGKEPFKPIIGCEMYVAPRTMHDKEKGDDECGRLIVLAKNLTGYKNLCKLVSNSWTEGLMGEMPRTDHTEMEKYHEGLIVIATGTNSEIANCILANKTQEATSIAEWYKKIFDSDFYIGIERHDSSSDSSQDIVAKERATEPVLINIAQALGIKLVCTNNCNYLNKEDGVGLDHLYAIARNCSMSDKDCPHHVDGGWMHSTEEMNHKFSDLEDAISNTCEIFDKVEIYSIDNKPLMPAFTIPEGFKSENEYLKHLAYEGAKERYGTDLSDEVKERLDFELDTINTMGFPGYFLIVAELINTACKELGVKVGPGRGSAVGSIVAYCLGITKIDPLKYGLLFERFLNPDKISLPDIDTDFDDEGREKVLHWIREKYGEENVTHIITYGMLATKSAIKGVVKAEGVHPTVGIDLCSDIPGQLPNKMAMNIPNAISVSPKLQAAANAEPTKTILENAAKIEGTIRTRDLHACGIIISPTPISNVVPVCTTDAVDDGISLVTQYDGHYIEQTGLIKMDILGLKTLSEIKLACENIKKVHGIDVDIDNIPLDDEKTFELYQNGQTVGTFQFESAGMQKYLKELKPTVFEDLIAMNSLYRPGPMAYIPSFIARKNGSEPITYDLPCMEPYLKETYGVTVYQEQVMLMSREIAGFTRGESDKLRKAIAKKNGLEKLEPMFIEGGVKKGYSQEVLKGIWEKWLGFGEYAFNKSHSVAYAWLAYQTAYLKANYPAEFMAAMLTCHSDDNKRLKELLEECKAMKLNILSPDINSSGTEFVSDKDGNIHFSLCAIKGIGKNVAKEITEKRNSAGCYKDIFDFTQRVNRSICNRRVFEALAKCGTFDSFGLPREQYFGKTQSGKTSIDLIFAYAEYNDSSFFPMEPPVLPVSEKLSYKDIRKIELEMLGICFAPHPAEEYREKHQQCWNATCKTLNNLKDSYEKQYSVIIGVVTNVRTGMSRMGGEYGIVTFEDEAASTDIAFFGKVWQNYKSLMLNDKILVVAGFIEMNINVNRLRFKAVKVFDINNATENLPSFKQKLQ